MAFEVEDFEGTVADLRARGVNLSALRCRASMSESDIFVVPNNYPSKGTGELGTFFYDSEDNLLAIGQPVRVGATQG